MKRTFKFLAMALAAILMSVYFTACSDDDKKIDNADDLIGTWMAVHNKGWYKSGSEKEEWDEPAQDEIILKISSNGKFEHKENGYVDASGTWSLRGNTIVFKGYEDVEQVSEEYKIKSLDADELILERHHSGKDEDGSFEYYEVTTFTKL